LSVEKKEERRCAMMSKEQVLEMLKSAKAKIKEADDLIVQLQLWLMDKKEFGYAGIAEAVGEYLYKALREIRELEDIEDIEELQ
jgi:uncharacterized protein (DUF934 family)